MKKQQSKKGRAEVLDTTIGQNLRAARLEIGLSQTALADKLDLTFQQIQKYERATNRVAASRLYRISQITGKPVAYFYGGEDGKTPPGLTDRRTVEIMNSVKTMTDEQKRVVRAFVQQVVRA